MKLDEALIRQKRLGHLCERHPDGQGRHILAIAGAAAGFACIWAVTPVRREPQKKPN